MRPRVQPQLEFAWERLDSAPARTLMVGDSINDLLAARAAKIPFVCVPYGYNEGNDPRELPCVALIEDLSQLAPLLLTGIEARAMASTSLGRP
jgi:phosphoglycolate phosphatase